jgi:hypothetical protein
MNGFKRDGKGKSGRTESLRNSQTENMALSKDGPNKQYRLIRRFSFSEYKNKRPRDSASVCTRVLPKVRSPMFKNIK